jgi:hypothetical protein
MANTTVAIHVSDEIANKLYLAFLGLHGESADGPRVARIEERVKKEKISIQQATFEEILNPRVELYAERGQKRQEKKLEQAVAILKAQGRTTEEIMELLK